MDAVLDTLRRPLRDLRVSVTDRCNLRCSYCMPSEVFGRDFVFMERSELLSFEEIARLVAIAARLGVRKVRLTGGEPLLRRGIERLVEMLARIDGVEDLALTTNGTALAEKAAPLARAGLARVTVSLDTLDDDVFHSMSHTRIPLARVLDGIDAARAAGLAPVKVNMVVRRGVNEHEVTALAEHFRGTREIVRFIEYMDVGESNGWRREEVVAAEEILAMLNRRWPLQPIAPRTPGEVATRFAYTDGAGEIGVIASVTKPFCGACTRARLSAEGKLYTCLFATDGFDLRALLRTGAEDTEIERALRAVWRARTDRYSEQRARIERDPRAHEKIEMSYIGG